MEIGNITVYKAHREEAASLLRFCLLEVECYRSCIALCKVDFSWVTDMLTCKSQHVTQSKVAMMFLHPYCQPDWTWSYLGDTSLGGFLKAFSGRFHHEYKLESQT